MPSPGFVASAAALLLALGSCFHPSAAKLVHFCSVDIKLISVHDLDFKTLRQAGNASQAMLKLADGWLSVSCTPAHCGGPSAAIGRRDAICSPAAADDVAPAQP
jgi:hypothetical protein